MASFLGLQDELSTNAVASESHEIIGTTALLLEAAAEAATAAAASIDEVEGMAVKRGGEPTIGSLRSPLQLTPGAKSSVSLSFSELELVSMSLSILTGF